MHGRVRVTIAFASLFLLLSACTKREPGAQPSPSSSVSAPATPSAPLASAAPVAPPAPAVDAAAAPSGTATLVVQKVYADCGGFGGFGGSNEREHYLGTDVFVLVQDDGPKDKPRKEFVFCASRGADGGVKKPQLQTWQNCSAFPSCKILSPEAGPAGRVEVQCGKENIVVESDGTRTVIRGSFGEREIAPHPTTLGAPRSEVRKALVDC